MEDLIDWLRAALDDEERIAQAAQWAGDERWEVLPGQDQPFHRPWQVVDATYDEGLVKVQPHAADDEGVAVHVAYWEPLRVLAEIDAKRRILDLHVGAHDCTEIHTGVYPDDWPADAGWGKAGQPWAHAVNEHFEADQHCPTLRLLAPPMAGREGYRPEWRP